MTWLGVLNNIELIYRIVITSFNAVKQLWKQIQSSISISSEHWILPSGKDDQSETSHLLWNIFRNMEWHSYCVKRLPVKPLLFLFVYLPPFFLIWRSLQYLQHVLHILIKHHIRIGKLEYGKGIRSQNFAHPHLYLVREFFKWFPEIYEDKCTHFQQLEANKNF